MIKKIFVIMSILSTFVLSANVDNENVEIRNVISKTNNKQLEEIKESIRNNSELTSSQIDKLLKEANGIEDIVMFKEKLKIIFKNISELGNRINNAYKFLEYVEDENFKTILTEKLIEAKNIKESTDFDIEKLSEIKNSIKETIYEKGNYAAKPKFQSVEYIARLREKSEDSKISQNQKNEFERIMKESEKILKNEFIDDSYVYNPNDDLKNDNILITGIYDKISFKLQNPIYYLNAAIKVNERFEEMRVKFKDMAKNLTANNADDVNELINETKKVNDKEVDISLINTKIDDLEKQISKIVLDDSNYQEVADAFYYRNDDLFSKLSDNVYFDVKFNQHILKDYNSFGGLTLGGNYEFKNLDLKVGGFVEYDNNKAHNISLGAAVIYDDFSAFARYRLAILKKETNLLNHNFDVFAKYSHNFKFDKVTVEPVGSVYMIVSSKVKIDDYLLLKPRFGFDVNLGTKVSYYILDDLNIYAAPSISVGYNNQKLEIENTKYNKNITRSYFNYAIDFGANYTINNFVIRPNIKLNGDTKKNLNFAMRLGVGYNF